MAIERELAVAYVSLVPSAQGFNAKVKAELSGLDKVGREAGRAAGEEFSGQFGGSLKKLAGLAAAAFGAVKAGEFLKGSVTAASDLGESMSKVNVVFGESAGVIQDWSKTAATSLGLSRQQALEAAGTFGNLFRAMGLATGTAADMSTKLIGLAGDLASFNNANPDDVLLALRSGLVGETEPLRQFGVNLNEARIKAEALRLGLVKTGADTNKLSKAQEAVDKATRKVVEATKKYGKDSQQVADAVRDQEQATSDLEDATQSVPATLDAATKAQAAYSLIMQDTALAQGDFARTSGGLANQQRILSAQFTDLKATLGDAFLPLVTTLVTGLNKRVIPALAGFAEAAGPKIKATIDTFAAAFASGTVDSSLSGFYGLVGDAGVAVRGLVDFFRNEVPDGVHVFAEAFKTGASDLDGSGFLKFMGAAGAVVGDLVKLVKDNPDLFKTLAAGAAGGLGAAGAIKGGSSALSSLGSLAGGLGSLGQLLSSGGTAGIVVAVVAAIGAAAFVAYKKFKPFHDLVDKVGRAIGGFFVRGFNDARDAVGKLADIFGSVKDRLSGVIDGIRDVFSRIGDIFAGIRDKAGEIAGKVIAGLQPIKDWADQNLFPTFKAIGDFFAALGDSLGQAGQEIATVVNAVLGPVIDALKQSFGPVADVVRTVFGAVGGQLKALLDIIGGFAQVAVGYFKVFFDFIVSQVRPAFDIVVSVIDGVLANIRGIFQIFTGLLRGDWGKIWEGLSTIVEGAFGTVSGVIQGILDGITGGFRAAFDGMKAVAGSVFDGVGDILKGVVNGVIATLEGGINLSIDALNAGLNAIDVAAGPFVNFGEVPHVSIPRLAAGALVSRPTLAVVGDAGVGNPEIVAPERRIRELLAEAGVGRGGGVQIGTVSVLNPVDATADEVVAAINAKIGWMLTTRSER